MKYTIEASGSGNYTTLEATSHWEARRKAASLRDAFHSKVEIIKGNDIEYDRWGLPSNIVLAWAKDGARRWHRVNP